MEQLPPVPGKVPPRNANTDARELPPAKDVAVEVFVLALDNTKVFEIVEPILTEPNEREVAPVVEARLNIVLPLAPLPVVAPPPNEANPR